MEQNSASPPPSVDPVHMQRNSSARLLRTEHLLTCSKFVVERQYFQWPDGREFFFDNAVHSGAVITLPILNSDTILLIANDRPTVGRNLLELPAGTLEKGEDPLKAAERELIEETGYSAGRMDKLGSFYASPGFLNEKLFAYVARDLKFIGTALEENEKITTYACRVSEIPRLCATGAIEDAKTMATLMMYMSRVGRMLT